MNEVSIQSIIDRLKAIGINNALDKAVYAIACFRPEKIELKDITKEMSSTVIVCVPFLATADAEFTMPYYDVTLRKEIIFSETMVGEIDVNELDRDMEAVKWMELFSDKFVRTDMPLPSLEDSLAVFNIMQKLRQMELSNGVKLANLLRYKHWADTPMESSISGLSPIKGQFEVSQRFYFFDGEQPISKVEAVRFLSSLWMQKQVQAKKRNASIASETDSNVLLDDKPKGSGLLAKKRRIPKKKILRN